VVSSLIGGIGGGLPRPGSLVSPGSVQSAAGQLTAADPAKNPQPLSLYVFLFLSAALALLLLSMAGHMKRARRNLAPPGTAGQTAPGDAPAPPAADPPEAG
jgi:hypothetical protein